jgi:DNA-binding Lrp family transcriptional regulator
MQKTITFDELDHKLIHALQLDGRVPFARFAQLLEVSEQTVARRFRRMSSAGVLRVVGMVDNAALGESTWMVRIQSRPDAAGAIAEALAARDDVGWVSLTSGGAEILCSARSRTSQERDELLLRRLPNTGQVTGFSANATLHRFDHPASWTTGLGELTADQAEALTTEGIGGGARSADTWSSDRRRETDLVLSREDDLLLAELAFDGRTPIARLAQVTGWTPGRVSRRMEELMHSGLLYFDTEIAVEALGFRSMAMLWIAVTPAELQATGAALAGHQEVVFAAACTGVSNLVCVASCRDFQHLYHYVSEGLGALPAIRRLEISPILRRLKQNGSRMKDQRMVIPTR